MVLGVLIAISIDAGRLGLQHHRNERVLLELRLVEFEFTRGGTCGPSSGALDAATASGEIGLVQDEDDVRRRAIYAVTWNPNGSPDR